MFQVKNLTITHKKDLTTLVEGLSFTLAPGDRAAVIGEEGNGKSTVLKLLYDSALAEPYAEWTGEIVDKGLRKGYLAQELTPEELEEIRKREERKDRLHQNYLKRKASGAQKRYEDKIKGRKKAEIEAKKAAIRAEDIAKGVFVPVSSLPQREPMKGVQTA